MDQLLKTTPTCCLFQQLLNMWNCKKLPKMALFPLQSQESELLAGCSWRWQPKQTQGTPGTDCLDKKTTGKYSRGFCPNYSFSKALTNLETSWWTVVPKGSCLNPWEETKHNQLPSGMGFFTQNVTFPYLIDKGYHSHWSASLLNPTNIRILTESWKKVQSCLIQGHLKQRNSHSFPPRDTAGHRCSHSWLCITQKIYKNPTIPVQLQTKVVSDTVKIK